MTESFSNGCRIFSCTHIPLLIPRAFILRTSLNHMVGVFNPRRAAAVIGAFGFSVGAQRTDGLGTLHKTYWRIISDVGWYPPAFLSHLYMTDVFRLCKSCISPQTGITKMSSLLNRLKNKNNNNRTINEPGAYEWLRGEGAREVLFIQQCSDAAPQSLLKQHAD